MFPIIAIFSDIVSAIKVGDYRAAANGVGRLLVTLTSNTHAEVLKFARGIPEDDTDPADPNRSFATAPAAMSPVELYEASAAFSHELEAACQHSETVCRTGAASDATLSPGEWVAIAKFVLDVIRRFIKRPADWSPTPLPVPASVSGPEDTKAAVPGLPSFVKPSEREKPAESNVPSGETGTSDGTASGGSEGEDAEPPKPSAPAAPPAKPHPKPHPKKP